jgi:hypothetical protein
MVARNHNPALERDLLCTLIHLAREQRRNLEKPLNVVEHNARLPNGALRVFAPFVAARLAK